MAQQHLSVWDRMMGIEELLNRIFIACESKNVYCYNADPVVCPGDPGQVTFFAYEWVNPRYGKKIKEVNLCGTVDYQATQTNYGVPEYAPMKSNAIILAGLSKVRKREPYVPNAEVKK